MPTSTAPRVSYPAIEAALEAWIVAATGLPSKQVFHVNKKVPQPASPYVEIKGPSSIIKPGLSEQRTVTNLSNPAGSEVELQAIVRIEFTITLQSYSADPTPADNGAVDLLSRAGTALELDSRRAAFEAAGIVAIEAEQVLDLSSRTPGGQGRASMDVRFRTTDGASDFVGYIASVGLLNLTDSAVADQDPDGGGVVGGGGTGGRTP